MVLSGCHSLVHIEGETTGDPLESAPLKTMRWELSKDNGNAIPSAATEKRPEGKSINVFSEKNITELEVLTRHHFSSKLQRMSCVIKSVTSKMHYSVLKGSPEAVGRLLGTKPAGYEWAVNPIPGFGPDGNRKFPFKPLTPGACGTKGQTTTPECPDRITNWRIIDKVQLPSALRPGKYVLSLRWDAEQTPQVWASCSDFEIVGSGPQQASPPAPTTIV
jgi:hypothetical protein